MNAYIQPRQPGQASSGRSDSSRKARPFDLIVYGASGFTGRLVAEYLHTRYGAKGAVAWAMAGRSRAKLETVRQELGISAEVPLLDADAGDAAALARMVAQARAVITTVGPYQQGGEPLIQACIDAGTDYLDLCGEPAWMAAMIRKHQAAAVASGARIVFSCGFDSVPFDLGVMFLQHASMVASGKPLSTVHGRVLQMKGTFSGGTAASLVATVSAMAGDEQVRQDMINPFALTPGFSGPRQPSDRGALDDAFMQGWSAPFVMAPINTKNVHRSNFLLGHPYGRDFIYDERMAMGEGREGRARATKAARTDQLQQMLLGFKPTRQIIEKLVLPKPGTGPTAEQRENGRYKVLFHGSAPDGRKLQALVRGDRDPGYGSTSKIIAECALGLLNDVDPASTRGGIWTPAAAMGMAIVPRLQERAGLSFELKE
jgi:short subunit dehydrogenase-like uncharacterized protein